MNNKKILIVCKAFYPENSPRSFRATELAKEFARQGHEVVVYIPENGINYTDFMLENSVEIKSLGKLYYPEIGNGHGKIMNLVYHVIRRILLLPIEYPDIELMFKVFGKLKSVRGFDLLISVAVPFPVHWGVARVVSKSNKISKIWVADCGDPYMGNKADSFRKLFYFKYIEKWFCRKADYLTIPTEGALGGYYSEFHSKIRIIPQGFRFVGISLPEKEINNAVPTFAYAGGFIPGIRDPRPFLDFLATLQSDFRFFIYTMDREIISPYLDILNEKVILLSIIFRGRNC